MSATLNTGGALGADEYFANESSHLGFTVKIHSFEGHTTHGKGEVLIHSQEELELADEYLAKAAQFLKRSFPSKNKYVTNLLRRNYFIIKDVECVYAVGNLLDEYRCDGGTGWGTELSRQLDKTLFLFNLKDGVWYTSTQNTNYWPLACSVPKLELSFAGIGTRKLSKIGKQAIKNLLTTV